MSPRDAAQEIEFAFVVEDSLMLKLGYSAPRRPEGVLFDAPSQGNIFPNDACVLNKKDRLHPDRVTYGLGTR